MFQGCFLYNYKSSCYIYYPKTLNQKRFYKDLIQKNNNNEIKAKVRNKFNKQQAKILEKQRLKRKKKPRKLIDQEVYQNYHKQKRNRKYKSRIDNIRYTYKYLIPLLILFINKINIQIYHPNNYNYDIPRFFLQQNRAPSHSS